MLYYYYIILYLRNTLLRHKINNKETAIIPHLRFNKNKSINFSLHYFYKNQLKNNNNLHFSSLSFEKKIFKSPNQNKIKFASKVNNKSKY